MDEEKHIYRARLDFLYQSIAVYAATLVLYLIVRSIIQWKAFPTLWQDPLLLLLSAITLLGALALVYNLVMRRQIEIAHDAIHFTSRARSRTIARSDVASVQIGPASGRPVRRVRTVHIRMKGERHAVRIRLANFEHGRKLLAELREWAGPLVIHRGSSSGRSRTARA
ncbi:MAG: hypothetical protein ACHQNE_06470 [Candidatus Kapaibacterium sp.]